MQNQQIIDALKWRYAVKIFDPSKKVSEENMQTILESAHLAPSSTGLEPWKFLVIKNVELRKKIREAGYGQPKITDASHLVVIAHRTDASTLSSELIERTGKNQGKTAEELAGLKGMADGAINGRKNPQDLDSWLAAQTYIPLGMMVETAALLGVDAGPMEGFIPTQVDEILGLKTKNLASTTMIAFGYRGDDPYAKLPKTRRPLNEIVEVID